MRTLSYVLAIADIHRHRLHIRFVCLSALALLNRQSLCADSEVTAAVCGVLMTSCQAAGMGFEIAKALVEKNANVIIASRNKQKCDQ